MTITTCCISRRPFQKSVQNRPSRAIAGRIWRATVRNIGIRRRLYTIAGTISTRGTAGRRFPRLAVNPGDSEEIRRLQAGAADQGAVDVGNSEQLTCVGGLHRAAVE